MTKLSQLKDAAIFRLSKNGPVKYRLDKLHKQQRMATYTSLKSNRTFTSGWGKEVWV